MNLKPVRLTTLASVIILSVTFLWYQNHNDSPPLKRVNCWFSTISLPKNTECFLVTAPEDHASPKGKHITFPLVKFKSERTTNKPPILHLGAGGPGAPMYLDDDYVVEYLLDNHNGFSTLSGRDFYIIDPRGTGLAEPRLNCDTYVDTLPKRLSENLSQTAEWKFADEDYLSCINKFKNAGVNLANFNSVAISNDVELLRKALGVEKWTLIGVSYGAVYAQVIAGLFPDSVEALILDSAAFPNLKMDNHFVERTMAPYEALYNYCLADKNCEQPLENTATRIWSLYEKLNAEPIALTIANPNTGEDIPFALNGSRFLASLIEGVYGEDIFQDLPLIIVELENGKYEHLLPYIDDYTAFLFDTTYGDISASAHYCFDDKPYIDFAELKRRANEIEEPHIKEITIKSLEWPDLCDEMGGFASDPITAAPLITTIPTLFLHGNYDSITPLSDVMALKEDFSRSQIYTFDSSHSILGSSSDIEILVANFLDSLQKEKTQ